MAQNEVHFVELRGVINKFDFRVRPLMHISSSKNWRREWFLGYVISDNFKIFNHTQYNSSDNSLKTGLQVHAKKNFSEKLASFNQFRYIIPINGNGSNQFIFISDFYTTLYADEIKFKAGPRLLMLFNSDGLGGPYTNPTSNIGITSFTTFSKQLSMRTSYFISTIDRSKRTINIELFFSILK